jgi:hypothetical protein
MWLKLLIKPLRSQRESGYFLCRGSALFLNADRAALIYNPTRVQVNLGRLINIHPHLQHSVLISKLDSTMSKLSPALKALINSPAARPSIVPAPAHITSVYQAIQQTAIAKRLSDHSWLTLSVSNNPNPFFCHSC